MLSLSTVGIRAHFTMSEYRYRLYITEKERYIRFYTDRFYTVK